MTRVWIDIALFVGFLGFGGLVKVALFFGVGSVIARPLRHRFNEDKKSRMPRA